MSETTTQEAPATNAADTTNFAGKFIANREDLLSAICAAAAVIPARTPNPAFQALHMQATKTGKSAKVVIRGMSPDMGIEVTFDDVDVQAPLEVLVFAEDLRAVVGAQPDETLTIESDGIGCIIRASDATFRLNGFAPDQLPPLAKIDSKNKKADVKIPAHEFAKAIDLVLPCATSAYGSFAVDCACIMFGGKQVRFACTDGAALAMATLECEEECAKINILLPRRASQLIQKMCKSGDARIATDGSQMKVRLSSDNGTIDFVTNLIEGTIPPFDAAMDRAKATKTATFSRTLLVAALQRSQLMATKGSTLRNGGCAVDLNVIANTKKAALERSEAERGHGSIELPVTSASSDIALRINPRHLIDCISQLDIEEVEIGFGDTLKDPMSIRVGKYFVLVSCPLDPKS